MARKSIIQRIKKWLTGGEKPKAKATAPRTVKKVEVIEKTPARREFINAYSGKASTPDRQEKADKLKEKFKASEASYKSMADSVKRNPPKTKAVTDEKYKRVTEANKKREADYNKATNNRYNVSGAKDKAEELKRRQAVKSRAFNADTAVAEEKYELKYHPVAYSAARRAARGASLTGELLEKKGTKGEAKKAQKYFEKNQNKVAGGIGEAVGTMASFGLTSGASKAVVKKALPKAVRTSAEKGGEKLAARLAEKKLIRKAAENEVKNAVKKGVAKEASKEAVNRVAKQKAKELVENLGEDFAQNITTGALNDISRASANHKVGSKGWRKEVGESAALNFGLGGAATVGLPTAGKGIKRALGGVSEGAENALERLAKETDIKAKAEEPKVQVDLNRRRKTDVKLPVEPSTNNQIADAETSLISQGESAKAGERTEFRRADEVTAKEQARNRRTANNRAGASQETFDRDFADFENKASELQARANDLKSKIRSTKSEEEKATLKSQLDEVNAEMRREYNKASMRYHPDRGGSDDWMGKFNNAYSDYKRGAYSSRGFKNAESTARTATGGGGNTPPPRRAQAAADSGNFRRPKGKATSKQRVIYDIGDVTNKKRQRKSNRERIREFTSSVRTKMADSLSAFEDEARKKAKTDHQGMLDDYGAIDKTRRYNSIAGKSIEEKQLKWNGDRYSGTVERNGHAIENGKSLKEIYDGMDEATEKEFDNYLLLRHAPDRIREGKPIFDNTIFIDGRSLNDPKVCEEEAEKILKRHPEFAEKAEEIYQYTRNELQNRVDAGLLSPKVASEWNYKYPSYVPTGRDGDFSGFGGINGNVGASELKAAKGSDLDIRSIKEQLADATSRNWRDMSLNNLFKRMFGDRVATELSTEVDGGLEKVLDNTIGLSKSRDSRKHYAEIFVDGDMHRVEIEKRFYDSIEDLYKNGRLGNGLDVMTDAASKVATPFKNLITSWNPIFMVKNGLRDFSEAIINTRNTKEFLTSMPAAMKELVSNGEYARALRDSGVSQANFVNLEEALVKDKTGASKALNRFVALQDMVETYPRLVEYMATFKKAGVDLKNADMLLRDRAAANAADVTVNFGRSGSVGKMLNKGLVPFFNPSVQGWSKFIRNISEQNGVKPMLSLLVKATALGAGATAINNFLLEDNKNYQQISARDKATNYIIPFPPLKDGGVNNDANLFIKIPRSRFAAAYGIPAVNLFNENDMGWAEMLKVAGDQVAPVDPIESNILAPFLLAGKNETWFGTPIVSQAIENKTNPSEEYDANTSAIGKALGKATSNLPKELQISPKKADYVIDAETGVIGDFVLPALTPSKQGGGDAINKYVTTPASGVLKKAFAIDSVTQNDLSTRFYNSLNEASDNSKSSKGGEAEKEEYKRLNAYSTEISGISQAIRHLQDSDRKTKQADIYGLQKVKNQFMQDALDGKPAPSHAKQLDAVQKYVGTSYAVDNFGSSADKEAMKVYGASKYGNLSADDMAKKIDSDKAFYKGVKAIGTLEDRISKEGVKGNSTLTRAVALASVDADDDLFGAYQSTKKSRTESATKMERARNYINNGGSVDEYVKLEKTRKTVGKLSDFDKDAELNKILKQLKNNEITEAEYYQKQGEIKYNANISYVGLATSLAQANAPARGYELYDIKPKNIRKGINLAAMGFTARDYREMAKAIDTNGNGYPSKAEVIAFVANSDVADKATLYDALYYYKSSYNPFGAVTNYSRDKAAQTGKANGINAISNERGDFEIGADSESSSGYGGYRRRRGGYRRYGSGGSKAQVPKTKVSDFKASKATYKDMASSLPKRRKSVSESPVVKVEPPKVKFKKYEV